MLTGLHLRNFKCFGQLSLQCAPLTLMTGLNGMGKSSVIQALLVLRQSFETRELHDGNLLLAPEPAQILELGLRSCLKMRLQTPSRLVCAQRILCYRTG